MVDQFSSKVIDTAKKHIPFRRATFTARSHPWITTSVLEAVNQKCEAFGTDLFPAAARKARDVLAREYTAYHQRLRQKLSKLPRSSKQWWKSNRELLNKSASVTSIPHLKRADGLLATKPAEMAELLSQTFASKCTLPPGPEQSVDIGAPHVEMSGFMMIRSRWMKQILRSLKVDEATGPDGLPDMILKKCACCSAAPFTKLCWKCLFLRSWPDR